MAAQKYIAIRVSHEMYYALKARAASEHCTSCSIIRKALANYLEIKDSKVNK